MAKNGTTLQMKFGTISGPKTWSFAYADPRATTESLHNLANAMITNGSIFKNKPLSNESIQLVTTTVTSIDPA